MPKTLVSVSLKTLVSKNVRIANTSVFTVNYNTPDLVQRLLNSVRLFYPDIHFVVLDNSDEKARADEVLEIAEKDGNMTVHQTGKNLHHGPGMGFGVRKCETDHVLVIDSDNELMRPGLLSMMMEYMDPEVMAVGIVARVDEAGMDTASPVYGTSLASSRSVPYVLPHTMLVRPRIFDVYPEPIKHGAPMISTCTAMWKAGESYKCLRNIPRLERDGWVRVGEGETWRRFGTRQGVTI